MDYLTLKKQFGIGLTGGIACGKTTVATVIKDSGYPVFSADQLGKDVVLPGKPVLQQLVNYFGTDILAPDGSLDRNAFSKFVFGSRGVRLWVERVIHPAVRELLKEKLKEAQLFAKPSLWFYDCALLFENEGYRDFREIWYVKCSRETQTNRLKERGTGLEQAERIISIQKPPEKGEKLADFVIDTDKPIEEVKLLVAKKLSTIGLIFS